MRIALQPHISLMSSQLEDLKTICKYSHWCNFSEMGAGKTLPHVLLSIGALEDDIIDMAIIVTRKIVLGDWYMTYRDMADCDYKNLVTVYQAPRSVRPHMKLRQVVLMTYSTLAEDYERFVQLALTKRLMIVFDEAHELRNMTGDRPRSTRVKGVLKPPRLRLPERLLMVAEQCKRVYPLTGTPTPNGLENSYAYIRLMTGTRIYASHRSFKIRHIKYSPHCKHLKIGYKDELRIADLMSSFSTRHLKKDIMDLPPKTFKTRFLDWDPTQRKLYEELAENHIIELDNKWLSATDLGARLVRLHQIVTNPQQLGLDCDSTRFKAIEDDLEDIGLQDHKVVIFAYYRHTVKRLAEQLAKYNPAVIYGGVSDVEAPKDKFKFDDTCRLMIANPESAGVGTNFTVAHHIVFFEYGYDFKNYDQAVDRCHRKGQHFPLTIINYALRGSMEPRKILPRLIEKKEISATLLKDPKEYIDFIRLEDCEEDVLF